MQIYRNKGYHFVVDRKFLTQKNSKWNAWKGNVKCKVSVLQMTVVGSLLFHIYINDLPDMFELTVRLFTNDCWLYRTKRNWFYSQILQKDLYNLHNWKIHDKRHSLVTSTKRKPPRFKIWNTWDHTLPINVKSVVCLVLNIDSDLSWITNIGSICHKANNISGFLKRNIQSCTSKWTVEKNASKNLC